MNNLHLITMIKNYQVWVVYLGHNYIDGSRYNFSFRGYHVIADSESQARQIALDNRDSILEELKSKRNHNSKLIIRKSDNLKLSVGRADSGKTHKILSTTNYKSMWSPEGKIDCKLDKGNIVDIKKNVDTVGI